MFAHKVTDKMISKNNERNRSPRSLNQYFIRNEDLDPIGLVDFKPVGSVSGVIR